MTDTTWYYARDNQELGPVTTAQLKALLKKGDVEPANLIWKEGMENWRPANEVAPFRSESATSTTAVFRPADSSEPKKPKAAQEPKPKQNQATHQPIERKSEPIDLTSYARWGGYGIVLLSLLTMVSMRGCAGVAAKNETRLQQQLSYAKADFDRPLREKQQVLLAELEALDPDETFSSDRANELRSEIDKLKSTHDRQRIVKEASEWANLQADIASAAATTATIDFYAEFGFAFASVALLLGLFGVAVFGDPPQRWVSLIMIAIVLYGLVGFGDG